MYKIKVIYCGSIFADNSFHFAGSTQSHYFFTPSVFYLVESNNLRILVDSGFDPPEIIKKNVEFEVHAKKNVKQILKEADIDPDSIQYIIYTHLHWDHMGNIPLFNNAQLICQKEELTWALNPPKWMIGYDEYHSKELSKIKDRFKTIDGNVQILPGIEGYKLGGHSYGSQAIFIETENGTVGLAGDNIPRYGNIEKDIPAGLFVNLKETYEAIDIVKKKADIILPSHDWELFERYEPIINMPDFSEKDN